MPKRPHARRRRTSLLPPAEPAAAILKRHLPDLYLAVGKDLFDRYIDEIVEQKLAVSEKKLVRAASAPPISYRFAKPPQRARARIDFLNQLVRKSPPEGIRCLDALKLLATVEGRGITRPALREFVRRYMAYHELVMLGGQVRLKTEAVIELLARERAKKIVEMKSAEKVEKVEGAEKAEKAEEVS